MNIFGIQLKNLITSEREKTKTRYSHEKLSIATDHSLMIKLIDERSISVLINLQG
mgnify:CR=1 FL=1